MKSSLLSLLKEQADEEKKEKNNDKFSALHIV